MSTVIDLDEVLGGAKVAKVSLKVVNAGDGLSKSMAVKPEAIHKGDTVDVLIRCKAEKFNLIPIDRDDVAASELELVCVLVAGTATIVKSAATEKLLKAAERAIEEAAGTQRLPGVDDDEAGD